VRDHAGNAFFAEATARSTSLLFPRARWASTVPVAGSGVSNVDGPVDLLVVDPVTVASRFVRGACDCEHRNLAHD
jgi:hypothetical protein